MRKRGQTVYLWKYRRSNRGLALAGPGTRIEATGALQTPRARRLTASKLCSVPAAMSEESLCAIHHIFRIFTAALAAGAARLGGECNRFRQSEVGRRHRSDGAQREKCAATDW